MKIEVEMEDLQALFDLVQGSMDWGSGFYDLDDVTAMMHIAPMLGLDEMDGVPSNLAGTVAHSYAERPLPETTYQRVINRDGFLVADVASKKIVCKWCSLQESAPIHHVTTSVFDDPELDLGRG